jgi:hypothetical protein
VWKLPASVGIVTAEQGARGAAGKVTS